MLTPNSLSELKNLWALKWALNNSLKKPIYGGNNLEWKFKPTPTNIKNISNHYIQFQLTFFLGQATIVVDIFRKLLGPPL